MKVFRSIRNLITPLLSDHPQDSGRSTSESSSGEVDLPSEALDNCRHILKFTSENEAELKRITSSLVSICPHKHWFTLCKLDLCNQNLTSICDLVTVFPSLEILVLSDNLIQQVSGLPTSIRTLKIKHNRLTDINEIVKLENLRYLDICNNSISSFKGIEVLYHLKVIHAENNKVLSCSPFSIMHGLVKLNLRGNRLKNLKFQLRSDSLEYLDVSYNRIVSLDSIEGLTQLKVLCLEHNEVESIQLNVPLEKLKVLGLDFNRLTVFNGSFFPGLRTLTVDDNHISSFLNLDSCSKLTELSIRDQCGIAIKLDLRSINGAQTLLLSGNLMKSIPTMFDFYTLGYLEMCGVQLNELPRDFAIQVPNITVLCLCHNYLESIKPLRKLYRLQKLVLLNNRLENVNDLIKNLRSGDLHYLDLRDNPMTFKYYPTTIPSSESSKRSTCQCVALVQDDDWIEKDTGYAQTLSMTWQQRRSTYRAVIIKSYSHLTMLDGISISSNEKVMTDHIIHQHYNEHPVLW